MIPGKIYKFQGKNNRHYVGNEYCKDRIWYDATFTLRRNDIILCLEIFPKGLFGKTTKILINNTIGYFPEHPRYRQIFVEIKEENHV